MRNVPRIIGLRLGILLGPLALPTYLSGNIKAAINAT